MSQAPDDEHQYIERVMRRADAMGLSPQRVARAVNHSEPDPTEYQAVEEAQPRPRSWFRRSFARGSSKRS
jgi:hypothetical protein